MDPNSQLQQINSVYQQQVLTQLQVPWNSQIVPGLETVNQFVDYLPKVVQKDSNGNILGYLLQQQDIDVLLNTIKILEDGSKALVRENTWFYNTDLGQIVCGMAEDSYQKTMALSSIIDGYYDSTSNEYQREYNKCARSKKDKDFHAESLQKDIGKLNTLNVKIQNALEMRKVLKTRILARNYFMAGLDEKQVFEQNKSDMLADLESEEDAIKQRKREIKAMPYKPVPKTPVVRKSSKSGSNCRLSGAIPNNNASMGNGYVNNTPAYGLVPPSQNILAIENGNQNPHDLNTGAIVNVDSDYDSDDSLSDIDFGQLD